MTTSASDPGRRVPFLGYRPKHFAGFSHKSRTRSGMATRPLAIPSFHVTQKSVSTPARRAGPGRFRQRAARWRRWRAPPRRRRRPVFRRCGSPPRAPRGLPPCAGEGTSWRGCRAAQAGCRPASDNGGRFGEKRGHRAPLPEQPDGFERFLAGDVRQVDVAAAHRGQRKHAEDGLGLGNVGMRCGVIAGVLPPLGNGLGFQIFKDGVVFRMEGEEGPFRARPVP